MEIIAGLIIIAIAAFYFLPIIIMVNRGVDNAGIVIVNLLLGWTLLGWLVAAIWAIAETPNDVRAAQLRK